MIDPDRRARAARFSTPGLRAMVRNPMLRPHWIGGTDRFWYRREVPGGIQFTLVDAATGAQAPAFDHAAVAAALGGPPLDIDLAADGRLRVLGANGWAIYAAGHAVPEVPPKPLRPGENAAPDRGMAVFRHGDDLWLRDLATDAERRLTTDGVPYFGYGKSPDANLTPLTLQRRGLVLPAVALWSPDGRTILTSRLDERRVGDLPMVQHVPDDGSVRPRMFNMKFAMSGDPVLPMETHVLIDVASGRVIPVESGPHVTGMMTAIEREEAWWSADSQHAYVLDRDRLWRRQALLEITAATGAVREVFAETEATFSDTNVSVVGLPNIRVLKESNEFIWFSQRSGWGHLYLHDLATGARKGAITAGDWLVRDIVHVDTANRQVWLLAGGLDPAANPYHRTLCRVGFDGSGFIVLTPGRDDHALAMRTKRLPRDAIRPEGEVGAFLSPSGRYFVHTHSDLTTLPASELRRADGSLVAELARAELVGDWRPPLPFTVLADDGSTTLHGAMWLPSDFDPARKYPVIDYIYPGPQRGQLPVVSFTDFLPDLGRAALPQMFAELGFVVLNVDGRGTPLRSKAFHDVSYGRLQDAGSLVDHVAALRQLAARHTWFDRSRVGIMGHSGGGYATVRALLAHPDDFHVGIATAGNHDQLGYSFIWTEKYQGPVIRNPDGTSNYTPASNPKLAANLKGKLLLGTGDMDDNVTPALTMQLVDALIAADKDFDYIPLPNDDHTTVWSKPYFLRRAMEFMVRHLGVPTQAK
jgi:dipeptidyl aminopeptidase/acylaminoacyl peptidase